MQQREVVAWIAFDAADQGGPADIGGWGGSMTPDMRWADFVADLDEKHRPHYEALRRAVLARGLRRGGDWHQNAPDGVPLFDDGAIAAFSFRAWGDLMAAIWSDADGRGYGYMDFYMDSCLEKAGLALSPCL